MSRGDSHRDPVCRRSAFSQPADGGLWQRVLEGLANRGVELRLDSLRSESCLGGVKFHQPECASVRLPFQTGR